MFPSEARFLIVDDSTFTRRLVRSALAELGFHKMIEAEDVPSAQTCLMNQLKAKEPIHCVILDVNMPGTSGLKLVEWVRARDFLKELPILLLTSNREKEDVIEAASVGVTQYCTKPFDTPQLKERLEATWKRHGKKFFESLPKEKAS